jgi:hypothetical protein
MQQRKRAVDLDLNRIFAEDAEQAYLLGMFTISQYKKNSGKPRP